MLDRIFRTSTCINIVYVIICIGIILMCFCHTIPRRMLISQWQHHKYPQCHRWYSESIAQEHVSVHFVQHKHMWWRKKMTKWTQEKKIQKQIRKWPAGIFECFEVLLLVTICALWLWPRNFQSECFVIPKLSCGYQHNMPMGHNWTETLESKKFGLVSFANVIAGFHQKFHIN